MQNSSQAQPRRVAFFADSFHEVNGAARTCRLFEEFARRRGLPFLSIHCGDREETIQDGPVTILQLRRGPTAFHVDTDLQVDPFLHRRYPELKRRVEDFGAEVVHITGPGDVGTIGARIARTLHIPLAAAWHTNVHEFAGKRISTMTRLLPRSWSEGIAGATEQFVLGRVAWFYSLCDLILAPNQELVEFLEARTGTPARLMPRGVDTHYFSPEKRKRTDADFVLGYVGRLMPEKNVRYLIDLEAALESADAGPFRFLIVGTGSEEDVLRSGLKRAEFAGVLSGEALAEAYANMDLFVFPSRTDTFGNVVQEALASGVPAVVTDGGGPKFIAEHGVTGMIAATEDEMTEDVLTIMRDSDLHKRMRHDARAYALSRSWDSVFEAVYAAYDEVLMWR